ncbi:MULTISPECIES: protein kinase domain-containing protein [Photorhabdus]|uniref:protein kinase domain-containing protein n=1 Tax=Photorhabdus TaxID=29487 RepID=UPI001BD67E59|nr:MULTISPECIES: protein kinase [Photorhabdus]MBS9434557.1 serine/threonine protein kinase [Photorhabdus hainanensis]MCC8457340.1 protein kinase [Photorhabdus aegyptia]
MTSENVHLIRQRTCYSIPGTVKATNDREYDVGELINSGGNAVVHECIDRLSGDKYAIKFQVELRGNRPLRFSQEIQLLQSFDDPHIIGYVDHGEVKGYELQRSHNRIPSSKKQIQINIPFVILQLAVSSLSEFIKERPRLSSAEYLGQFIGLTKALVKINEKALHRDIKPENILIMGNTWVISDFGLCDVLDVEADLSGEGERIGPIFWMSPEALNKQLGCDDKICQASDIYQLASVLWYSACGRHPSGVVERADWVGPEEIFPILFQALAHNRHRRYQTSSEFCEALLSAIGVS